MEVAAVTMMEQVLFVDAVIQPSNRPSCGKDPTPARSFGAVARARTKAVDFSYVFFSLSFLFSSSSPSFSLSFFFLSSFLSFFHFLCNVLF